ncbi:MAG: hypothetical protein ACREXY_29435, partial [Gammaproteobacteria bacterium]
VYSRQPHLGERDSLRAHRSTSGHPDLPNAPNADGLTGSEREKQMAVIAKPSAGWCSALHQRLCLPDERA